MRPVASARATAAGPEVGTRSGRVLSAGDGEPHPPMELMLAALAGCAVDTLSSMLERMRHPARGVGVAVAGERAERPPRVWTRIEVTSLVWGDVPHDRLSRAVEVTERTCPVSVMAARAADVTSRWVAVRRVDPAVTRPLRRRILRPHQTLTELVAPGEEHPRSGWFAGIRDDGAVVGSVGVMPEASPDHPGRDGAWRLRAMAVDPELQGGGLGGLLLDAAVDHVRSEGGTLVWCSARVPARRFYERAGFTTTSDVYDQGSIGPHLRMELELG